MIDGRGWGREKMIFSDPPPPLSFLLPIVLPRGRTFFLSPVFHCMKNSRWQLNFLRYERSHEKVSPFAQFHVTQPFNRKNRNLPRLTEHPLSHPSTLRFLKYHRLSTSIPLSFKPLPTAKKALVPMELHLVDRCSIGEMHIIIKT